jgi:hypothetical protein
MKYLYKKIKSMRQLFKIDESEKKRILEMHENATKKNYLSEQETTTPPQQPSGPEINGKTYKIENIKNAESLNQFINWGVPRTSPESTSDTRKYDVTMANQLGYSYEGTELPEKPGADVDSEPVKKIKQVYADMDKIAQNYNLNDLCRGKNMNLTLLNDKSLTIAKNRAIALGWCVGKG